MKPAGEDSNGPKTQGNPEEPESPEPVEAPAPEESSEREDRGKCGIRWILANPVVIGLSIVGAIAGATVGAASDPKASSFFIIVMLFAYTILSINNLPYRLAPLAAMITAHVASILSYYSNPLPLPLVVVERFDGRYSINLDIVQIAIVYELYQIASARPCKPENTKTPTEESSIPADTGPTPGEEPR